MSKKIKNMEINRLIKIRLTKELHTDNETFPIGMQFDATTSCFHDMVKIHYGYNRYRYIFDNFEILEEQNND